MPNPCHYESKELRNESNMGDFEFLWAEFPEITEPSLSNVVTMTVPLHIVTVRHVENYMVRKRHRSKNNCVSGNAIT